MKQSDVTKYLFFARKYQSQRYCKYNPQKRMNCTTSPSVLVFCLSNCSVEHMTLMFYGFAKKAESASMSVPIIVLSITSYLGKNHKTSLTDASAVLQLPVVGCKASQVRS